MEAKQINGKRTSILIISLLLIAGLAGYILLITWYQKSLTALNPDSIETITFRINPGQSASSIGQNLMELGIIKDYRAFRYYSRQNNFDSRIKAGEYELSPSMSVEEILKKFITGDVIRRTRRFTIPEGYEIKQMAQYFELQGIVTAEEFYQALNQYNIPEYIKNDERILYTLEGYLFPDTYEIYEGATAKAIINMMNRRFEEVFDQSMRDRAKEIGMEIHDVVTLASIIEREGVKRHELPIISSVFHNRLNKGMLLQSCATVQYIMEERRDILLYKDLEIESPYNTYKYSGLPPGPIASPGKDAIIAALYPEETDYLFFVAKPDGSHIFSKTLSDHNRAIRTIRNQD